MAGAYDVHSIEDVGRIASGFGAEVLPNGMTKGEERIRKYLARGDFFEQQEIAYIESWLSSQVALRAEAAKRTPAAFAERSTIAAEGSAKSARHSVVISIFALLVAIAALAVSLKTEFITQPSPSAKVAGSSP